MPAAGGAGRNVLRIEIAGDGGVSGGGSGRSNGGGGGGRGGGGGGGSGGGGGGGRGGRGGGSGGGDPFDRPPPGSGYPSYEFRGHTMPGGSEWDRYQDRLRSRYPDRKAYRGSDADTIKEQMYQTNTFSRRSLNLPATTGGKYGGSKPYGYTTSYKNNIPRGPSNRLDGKPSGLRDMFRIMAEQAAQRYTGMSLSALRAGGMAAIPFAGALALKKTSDYFIDRGDKLAKFSPDIVVGQVQASMTRLFADMREAQALGPGIGRLIEAEADLTVAIRDMILPLKKLVVEELADLVKALSWIARLVEGGVNIGDYLPEGASKVWEGIKKAVYYAEWVLPFTQIRRLGKLLFDWLGKQLETQKDDPFGIFQKMVQGVQLAPDGAGQRFSPRAWWSPEIERKPMGVQ